MLSTINRTATALDSNVAQSPSAIAQARILSQFGRPLLFADWMRVLMIHFEVDAPALQRQVPYPLDLWNGSAFVTLVAFTMENMRPRNGGKLAALLFKPIATHDFLNVRTYVHHHHEPGIHFLAEWLSSTLAVWLGPITFGLPYRYGKIRYANKSNGLWLSGCITDPATKGNFAYQATRNGETCFQPCVEGSLDQWLMERYSAFNAVGRQRQFFRVWHPPWPQCRAKVDWLDTSLLEQNWEWFKHAQLVGANFSPGLRQVSMSRPHHA